MNYGSLIGFGPQLVITVFRKKKKGKKEFGPIVSLIIDRASNNGDQWSVIESGPIVSLIIDWASNSGEW